MKNTFYVTTPIYYPSGKFHIGTAYSTLLADAIKRYKSLRGYDAYMLTGLDEHGQKVEKVALDRNLTPQEHVDEMANISIDLWKLLKITNDDFIRTTETRHTEVVEKVFQKLLDNDDIYLGEYNGWYCTPCESFFTETQLVDGKCPDCGRDVEQMTEESYFFNMKKYEKKLLDYYEKHPNFLQPISRKNEIINTFIKPGLEDLCITRTSFEWGIKVPSNPKHVIYVWLDALLNYITALGYGTEDDSLFNKYWPADVQIIGKDIIRFHAIYWPIFLMALDLELPKMIYAHGWYLMKDGKMSKSKGNVYYPDVLSNLYGVEAVRYLLLREISFDNDGVFSLEGFLERYNSDLSNDLGNIVSRTIGMINKYQSGIVSKCTKENKELVNYVDSQIRRVEEKMDSVHIADALSEIWKILSRTNKFIDETAPWTLFKEEKHEEVNNIMYYLVENIRVVAILIKPFMPETSEIILNYFNINEELKTWDSLKEHNKLENIKVPENVEPLFKRVNISEEIEKYNIEQEK